MKKPSKFMFPCFFCYDIHEIEDNAWRFALKTLLLYPNK